MWEFWVILSHLEVDVLEFLQLIQKGITFISVHDEPFNMCVNVLWNKCGKILLVCDYHSLHAKVPEMEIDAVCSKYHALVTVNYNGWKIPL